MFKNFKDIIKYIETIKQQIPNFETDERKEIKKNNKLIKDYIDNLTNVNEQLKKVIKKKYDELVPSLDEDLDNINLKLNDAIFNLRLISEKSYIRRLEFDKILYEIKNSKNLDIINHNLTKFIEKFKLIEVLLSVEDFKFSIPLYNYMTVFFSSNEGDEYLLKEKFDKIYWDCPDLILHIYIACNNLIDKYDYKWKNHDKQFISSLKKDDIINVYKTQINIKDEYIFNNLGYIYQQFLTNRLNIDDYTLNSQTYRSVISKYVDYNQFEKYESSELTHFYESIKSIYNDLIEFKYINKYIYLINIAKDTFNNKSSLGSEYKTFTKTNNSLNKKNNCLNNKLFKFLNKDLNNRKLKKYNNLLNKSNLNITKMVDNYKNLDQIFFQNEIINCLNENSLYLDVFKLWNNHYSYLNDILKDNNGNYEDYIEFLYTIDKDISDSINFLDDINIEDKIAQKSDLFGIKLETNDLNIVEQDFKYLLTYNKYVVNNINIDLFKLLLKVNKKMH